MDLARIDIYASYLENFFEKSDYMFELYTILVRNLKWGEVCINPQPYCPAGLM